MGDNQVLDVRGAPLGRVGRSPPHVERQTAGQRAEMGGRFDRVNDRLDRTGRRPDPRDA